MDVVQLVGNIDTLPETEVLHLHLEALEDRLKGRGAAEDHNMTPVRL